MVYNPAQGAHIIEHILLANRRLRDLLVALFVHTLQYSANPSLLRRLL